MNQSENAVVVGVGPDDMEAALVFAVAEARHRRCGLHLVHVIQVQADEAYAGVYGAALDLGTAVIDKTTAQARELAGPDLVITSERVDNGFVRRDLVRSADAGQIAVLQHGRHGVVHRVLTGSIATGVAARARGPVVSVPQGWHSVPDRPIVVTAAVQNPQEAALIMRSAFEQAQLRGARLVVLHAWWLASGYDTVVVDDTWRTQWTERFTDVIAPTLERLATEFPEVEVSVRVVHTPVAEALLDATETSDLLVIGRRHHLLPLRTHLGPVARAVLGHSRCPVLVTPEPGAHDQDDEDD